MERATEHVVDALWHQVVLLHDPKTVLLFSQGVWAEKTPLQPGQMTLTEAWNWSMPAPARIWLDQFHVVYHETDLSLYWYAFNPHHRGITRGDITLFMDEAHHQAEVELAWRNGAED